ncbi:UNVERIFIED_CONTAM: hypothetical protein FKN15_075035 [Acipenser sinensis]
MESCNYTGLPQEDTLSYWNSLSMVSCLLSLGEAVLLLMEYLIQVSEIVGNGSFCWHTVCPQPTSLVFSPDAVPERPAVETTQALRPAQSGAGDLMESRPIEPAALGLAPEWLHLSHLDLSNRISDIPAKCQSSIHAFPVRVQVGRLSDVVPASEVRTHNLSHELSFLLLKAAFLIAVTSAKWATTNTQTSPAIPVLACPNDGLQAALSGELLCGLEKEEARPTSLSLAMSRAYKASAFLDALDVRKVLVGRENQRGERSDLRERNRESGEHLGRPRVLFREG